MKSIFAQVKKNWGSKKMHNFSFIHPRLIITESLYNLLSLELVLHGCQCITTLNSSEWKTWASFVPATSSRLAKSKKFKSSLLEPCDDPGYTNRAQFSREMFCFIFPYWPICVLYVNNICLLDRLDSMVYIYNFDCL